MGYEKNLYINVLLTICTIPAVWCFRQLPSVNPGLLEQTKFLGDCQACKLYVDSFKKGLQRTARGKFEGGDAAWEEEKFKTSYKYSEVRLIEIQDRICTDEPKHLVQCYDIGEKAEELIEQWWQSKPDENDDLFSYICIEGLKLCCPRLHFGKDCTPCPGDHNNICNGNGRCRGDGTRKGNGTCYCDVGYTGENCDKCSTGYYLLYNDENKIICSACHVSCTGGCRYGTQRDCAACKKGFVFDKDEGCLDVNECEDENKCKNDEFCLNAIGSYICIKCDKSCDRCHGDGPDMCRKCAKGFSRKGDFCIKDREDEDLSERYTHTSKQDL